MIKKLISVVSITLISFVITGCANDGKLSTITNSSSGAKTKNTRTKPYSYTVKGRQYQVNPNIKSYSKTGIASWYGPGFHGKKTANGERYNQNALTAAHKTLPIGSVVRVKNLSNGKSVVVRINDRGPFAHGRIIDLSKKAALKLDMHGSGTAKVRVTLIRTASGSDAEMNEDESSIDKVLALTDSGSSRYTD
ncbi:MAG: septal ring lytic transglycosylase RlpA family protein [Alphaproteobacteria bacterium]